MKEWAEWERMGAEPHNVAPTQEVRTRTTYLNKGRVMSGQWTSAAML